MLADKVKEFVARLGGDKKAEETVNALLAEAEKTDKAAQEAGVKFKEQATPPVPAPETPAVKETSISEQPGMFVADMKPEEFDAHLAKAVATTLAPVIAEMTSQINAIGDKQAQATKEIGTGLTAQIQAAQKAQVELAARLAALEGLTPRGYRASQDPATITEKDRKGPGADEKKSYFEQFVNGFVLGQPGQTPPTS